MWLFRVLFFPVLFFYYTPPPPPPPFSPSLLSLSAQGGYSAPSFSPWQGSFQGISRTVPPHRRQSESVLLTHPSPSSSRGFPFARTVHHVISSFVRHKLTGIYYTLWPNLNAFFQSLYNFSFVTVY